MRTATQRLRVRRTEPCILEAATLSLGGIAWTAFAKWEGGLIRRPFRIVELSPKVDAALSAAVLANGLLVVRAAKADAGAAIRCGVATFVVWCESEG